MESTMIGSSALTADYRRQARRIRASFATQPVLRHYALHDLARQHDAAWSSPPRPALLERTIRTSARRVPPRNGGYLPTERGSTTSAVERGFADHAADRLGAGTFTFSDRARLINIAEKLGIPRFRANLIVALEQHRIEPLRSTVAPPPKTSRSLVPQLMAIMMIEAVVVGLFVWACTL